MDLVLIAGSGLILSSVFIFVNTDDKVLAFYAGAVFGTSYIALKSGELLHLGYSLAILGLVIAHWLIKKLKTEKA